MASHQYLLLNENRHLIFTLYFHSGSTWLRALSRLYIINHCVNKFLVILWFSAEVCNLYDNWFSALFTRPWLINFSNNLECLFVQIFVPITSHSSHCYITPLAISSKFLPRFTPWMVMFVPLSHGLYSGSNSVTEGFGQVWSRLSHKIGSPVPRCFLTSHLSLA